MQLTAVTSREIASHLGKHTQIINKTITLSIVAPVYNEQEVLQLFHQQVCEVIAQMPDERVEIIYINDGSSDNSWQLMQELHSDLVQIKRVNLSRNFGKEAAMTAGFDYCKGDYVTVLDADLQDPPELLPDMLEAVRQGFDVVNMKRRKRHGESKFKILSAKLYYRLLHWLADEPIEQEVGDFRLLSKRVVEHIKSLPERNRYMKGIMSWPGFKATTLYFDRPERAAGTTKWSFFQLVKLALSGITSFSVKPLKLATWLGSLVSMSAFSYGMWVLIKTLVFGESVAGYPTIVLLVLFLGGVNLLALGFIGEYLGQIYMETKGRPIYLVDEVAISEAQFKQECTDPR